MSNTLAIAAVTTTMRHVLHEALGAEPDPVGGSDVTTFRPAQLADSDTIGSDARGLNVYLYLVTPNHAWNLTDLPTRDRDGTLVSRPLTALDLHFLITAYGDEAALEPQRLLARASLALATTPVFTKEVIADAVAKYGTGSTAFLQHTDLDQQPELVKVSATPLSLEELSKLWQVLGTPYLLTQTYTATVVLLEADVTVRRAPPVRRPVVHVQPFTPVTLVAVEVDGGGAAVTGATLVLTGSGLLFGLTMVTVDQVHLVPDATSTPSRVTAALPDDVPAGVHAVAVVHLRPADPIGGEPERVLGRSAALPVAMLPTVGPITTTATQVSISVRPGLQEGQRATVSFGRVPDGEPDVPSLIGATFPPVAKADAPLTTLDVDCSHLTSGTWLVRVSVDGAESLPILGADGTYDAPVVTIP